MDTLHRFVGIDVSKGVLEVKVLEGGASRFANDSDGIQQLLSWLGFECGDSPWHCGVEATSRYHVEVCDLLEAAGGTVNCFNPYQARSLAIGLGYFAKTDRVDARVLAELARLVRRPYVSRSAVGRALRDLSRQIQYLTDQRSCLMRRASLPSRCLQASESDQRLIACLSLEVKLLEKQWLSLLRGSALHSERYELLLSVPRIGVKTARVITSELPENLSEFSAKEVAAYFGLVPYDFQSGQHNGRGTIGHRGNAHLRKSLFCPATLAMYLVPEFVVLSRNLEMRGKHHLQIVTAIMHKLARRAIAVLLRGTPWQKEAPLSRCRT